MVQVGLVPRREGSEALFAVSTGKRRFLFHCAPLQAIYSWGQTNGSDYFDRDEMSYVLTTGGQGGKKSASECKKQCPVTIIELDVM